MNSLKHWLFFPMLAPKPKKRFSCFNEQLSGALLACNPKHLSWSIFNIYTTLNVYINKIKVPSIPEVFHYFLSNQINPIWISSEHPTQKNDCLMCSTACWVRWIIHLILFIYIFPLCFISLCTGIKFGVFSNANNVALQLNHKAYLPSPEKCIFLPTSFLIK